MGTTTCGTSHSSSAASRCICWFSTHFFTQNLPEIPSSASFPPIIFSVELPFFFDTSGMHYPLLILTVHSYLWHILLIVTGILSGIFLVQKSVPMTPLSCSKNIKRQPTDASSRRLLPSFSRITLLYILFCSHRRISEPHSGSLW